MPNEVCLIVSMAEKCMRVVSDWQSPGPEQPPSLQPKHLAWMCKSIVENAEKWPPTKMHRWLGFIQGAMIANRMLDLTGARQMFDYEKNAFGNHSQDVLDHLDPDMEFWLDLGGES